MVLRLPRRVELGRKFETVRRRNERCLTAMKFALRCLFKDLLMPIVVAIAIELVMDRYRKEKARIHFRSDKKSEKISGKKKVVIST